MLDPKAKESMANQRLKKPLRRPMAQVRQLPLFKREIIERISPAGFEVLLAAARRISEGKLGDDGIFYGSTMITLDLANPGPKIRSILDPTTAERLAAMLSKDRKLQRRLERLGLEEASGVAGGQLADPAVDVRITAKGQQVLLDIDVEGRSQILSPDAQVRR